MTYTFPITYMACQTCKSRVNCDDCESCLESAMMRISGIHGASVQMAKKELLIDTALDEGQLADCLEDLGVFVN